MAAKSNDTKLGRPQVVTDEVLQKLETAFALDASDEEACFFADISPRTLYNYQAANPEFKERKEALKQRPVLIARQTVVNGIATDSKLAMEYLKAKRRQEFATKTEVENSGETAVTITYVHPTDSDKAIPETASGVDSSPGQ